MGGSRKSKMVTWASDVNLCQVRLFLSEDCPSEVGMGSQDDLQVKALWPLPSGVMGSDDSLPPGFGGIQPTSPMRSKLSQIPSVKWRCPPRFQVNSLWQVVAGEESREAEAQNQRELRVLEAIYPRLSSIPPNPSVLTDADDSNNHQYVPVVPITPIEDEDAAIDTPPLYSMGANSKPTSSQTPYSSFSSQVGPSCNSQGDTIFGPSAKSQGDTILPTGVEPSIVAAAHAALNSVMSRSGHGQQIDPAMLISILSNSKMLEQLVTSQATTSSAQTAPPQKIPSTSSFHTSPPPVGGVQSVASSGTQHIPPSSSPSVRMPSPSSSSTTSIHTMLSTSSQYSTSMRPPPNGSYYPPPGRPGPFPNLRPSPPDPIPAAASLPPAAPVTKDINYFKSLIQQHGEERKQNPPPPPPPLYNHPPNHPFAGPIKDSQNIPKPREPKPRITRPCMFFNSPKGCRNGVNCTYQHDVAPPPQQRVSSIPEAQSNKRMKLDREITGS